MMSYDIEYFGQKILQAGKEFANKAVSYSLLVGIVCPQRIKKNDFYGASPFGFDKYSLVGFKANW